MKEKIIVLLSGGAVSLTLLAFTKSLDREVIGLVFDYGQAKHSFSSGKKLELAKAMLRKQGLTGYILNMDIAPIIEAGFEPHGNISANYIPGKNLAMLSIAAGIAEAVDARVIFYGAISDDFDGSPD